MRVITFRAEEELIEKLLQTSKTLNINRSDLIRQAIMKIVSSIDNGDAIVCLELTAEEQLFLKLLAEDPVIALRKLLRQNMAASSWFTLAKGVVEE